MIEAALKVIYNQVTRKNVNCPYCWDSVSDLKDHLNWCK